MHAKTERLRHLYGWDSAYATMTPTAPEGYKYPDGIVLTLKTSNHSEHYFVERAFALQLASSIKESLVYKKPKPPQAKPQAKPVEKLPKAQKKSGKKPRPD